MRIFRKLIVFLGIALMGLPFTAKCSWQSDFCVNYEKFGESGCKKVSSGWTVPYCVSSDVDNAAGCNFTSLTNSLSMGLNSSNYNTKDMILQYCTSLLGDQNNGRIYYAQPSTLTDSWDWSKTFDSHQSLFVHLLCSSTVNKSGSFDLSGVFTGDVIKTLKLQQMSDGEDKCSKDHPTLNDCDMSLYATEIFSALMSEIFKVKYAQVFHVNSVEILQKDKKERVLEFLSGYFNMNDDSFITAFPNTVDVIDSNQQYYKAVLDSLRVLDNSVLAKKVEEAGCPVTGNMVGVDFIACALHGSQGNGMSLDSAFETLFYNELMSYRIFVSYYWNWIRAKLNNNEISNDVKLVLESKAIAFQDYANSQIEAAKQTLNDFEELNMSYPFHIGLLLYQEKIDEFRSKKLPSIVKIFYSLSEKLQNVQLPK